MLNRGTEVNECIAHNVSVVKTLPSSYKHTHNVNCCKDCIILQSSLMQFIQGQQRHQTYFAHWKAGYRQTTQYG